jgi:hypothetical protein
VLKEPPEKRTIKPLQILANEFDSVESKLEDLAMNTQPAIPFDGGLSSGE